MTKLWLRITATLAAILVALPAAAGVAMADDWIPSESCQASMRCVVDHFLARGYKGTAAVLKARSYARNDADLAWIDAERSRVYAQEEAARLTAAYPKLPPVKVTGGTAAQRAKVKAWAALYGAPRGSTIQLVKSAGKGRNGYAKSAGNQYVIDGVTLTVGKAIVGGPGTRTTKGLEEVVAHEIAHLRSYLAGGANLTELETDCAAIRLGAPWSGKGAKGYLQKKSDCNRKTTKANVDRVLAATSWTPVPVTASRSGKVRVGSKVSVKARSSWPGVKYSYQWLRDGKPIPGATGRTHKVKAASMGKPLAVQITAKRFGSATTTKTVSYGTPK